MNICDTKVFYDTEFEATISAAKHKEDMRIYQCGTHWHLTHADETKSRGFGGGRRYTRCPHCKQIYRRSNTKVHMRHFRQACLNSK